MTEPHAEFSRSPISRTVTVSTLPTTGFPVRIDASEAERGELAVAHGLSSVESFHADLELKRWRKDGVRIRGTIRAKIVQECIVTLVPVVSDLDIPVDAVFLPEDSPLRRPVDEDGALIVDPEGPDIPETFEGGSIDAGAIAEEFFELAIDPYPRAPGAELDEASSTDGDGGEDAGDNPFARLAALRDKL